MLSRTTLIAAAATIALSGAAVAGEAKGPTVMDDNLMDQLVAGAQYIANPSSQVVWVSTSSGEVYNPNNDGHGRPFDDRDHQGPFGVPAPTNDAIWTVPQGNWTFGTFSLDP